MFLQSFLGNNKADDDKTKRVKDWISQGFVNDDLSSRMEPFQRRVFMYGGHLKVPAVGQRVEVTINGDEYSNFCRLSGEVIETLTPCGPIFPQATPADKKWSKLLTEFLWKHYRAGILPEAFGVPCKTCPSCGNGRVYMPPHAFGRKFRSNSKYTSWSVSITTMEPCMGKSRVHGKLGTRSSSQ
jgi:hypothetical protein